MSGTHPANKAGDIMLLNKPEVAVLCCFKIRRGKRHEGIINHPEQILLWSYEKSLIVAKYGNGMMGFEFYKDHLDYTVKSGLQQGGKL